MYYKNVFYLINNNRVASCFPVTWMGTRWWIPNIWCIWNIFFLSGFSFTDTDDSQDSRGREGTIFYSSLPLPPAHEHSDIYLQFRMWDDIFLIASLVFTRLLLDDVLPPYRITIWLIDNVKFALVCLPDDLILGFCYSNLDTGNSHRLSPLYYTRTD